MSKLKLEPEMIEMLDYAIKHKTMIITTVEAFHKEPELLYAFLQSAANLDIDVSLAPIQTTDRTYAPKSNVGDE